MLAIKTNIDTNEVIKNIKEHQKLEFESFSNWIPAGSGNFFYQKIKKKLIRLNIKFIHPTPNYEYRRKYNHFSKHYGI